METRTHKVGDAVIFFGKTLRIDSIGPNEENGPVLAQCKDPKGEEVREKMRATVLELRKKQEGTSGTEHAAFAEMIEAASKQASAALCHVGLRIDLLAWWEEKQCWVSDGRILSVEQHSKWMRWTANPATHKKVDKHLERQVYLALEAQAEK